MYRSIFQEKEQKLEMFGGRPFFIYRSFSIELFIRCLCFVRLVGVVIYSIIQFYLIVMLL
jgi:hypothetical protein